jgi:hypothetical protein
MTPVSSMALNERACSLLSQGNASDGLELFKKALSVLKNEITLRSTGLLLSDEPQNSSYQEQEATDGVAEACFYRLLPAPKACKNESQRFWMYSHPLSMQRATIGSACAMWSIHSNVFTLSFNVALASHLQGVEQEMGGDNDAARHSYLVAVRMYNLTLCQCQAIYKKNGAILNILNDHMCVAIFNNLVHVHAMSYQSTAYAELLLKTLFYLVDSGRVTTVREAANHQMLLENACCLLMTSSNSAAAA